MRTQLVYGRLERVGMLALGVRDCLGLAKPLRELLGYATALRSITGGEGSFSMELAGYGPMDAATAKAALAESW